MYDQVLNNCSSEDFYYSIQVNIVYTVKPISWCKWNLKSGLSLTSFQTLCLRTFESILVKMNELLDYLIIEHITIWFAFSATEEKIIVFRITTCFIWHSSFYQKRCDTSCQIYPNSYDTFSKCHGAQYNRRPLCGANSRKNKL